MFNSDMDSLWDDSSIVHLVDNDSEGVCGDVENLTSLSVVVLVWHTLVDGSVDDDINVISNSVGDEISLEWSSTVLFERS